MFTGKTIGASAFYGCESLVEIILSESIVEIGLSAFACCYCLKEITIPMSVMAIGDGAFMQCRSLKRIICPRGSLREELQRNWFKYGNRDQNVTFAVRP